MTGDNEAIELAKNRVWPLLRQLEADLADGQINEAEWYERVQAIIMPAYLAMDNPRGQSGSDGDEADWEYKRGLLADAFDRDGTFLDVGCASGHLMETLRQWTSQRGCQIEPYGIGIALLNSVDCPPICFKLSLALLVPFFGSTGMHQCRWLALVLKHGRFPSVRNAVLAHRVRSAIPTDDSSRWCQPVFSRLS